MAEWTNVVIVFSLVFFLFLIHLLSLRTHVDAFTTPNFVKLSPAYASMPVKEYLIKASWDSAYTSDEVSTNQLIKVIENGYRFLDFEVFHQEANGENETVVAFSSTGTGEAVIESNTILFDIVMSCVTQNAFKVSNGSDPLFLHFRIRSTNPSVYEDMAKSLKMFSDLIYTSEKRIGDIPLSKLIGKVVCIFNRSKTSTKLDEYIAVESGTTQLKSTTTTQLLNEKTTPVTRDATSQTDVSSWKMATPDLGSLYTHYNLDHEKLHYIIKQYGAQIIPSRMFYNSDAYHELFKNSAFLTLASAIS